MKRTFALASLALLLAVGASAQTVAPVPQLMNFQGRLTKKDGTPVTDGFYTVTFSIYDAQTGGNLLWKEQSASVYSRNGVIAILLGNITPLTDSIFNGTVWLEMQVNTDAPLSPRQRVTSVAFAFKANTVPDKSITTAKIADGAITAAKLAPQIFQGSVPPGVVIAYAGATVPDGYLMCDGKAISRTQYPALFTAIGVAHGIGDAISTFNLPDYRGLFLRMVDGAAGRDPDVTGRTAMANGGNTGNTVGSVEFDIFGIHSHGVNDPGHSHTTTVNNYGAGDTVGYQTSATVDGRVFNGFNTWTTDGSFTGISIRNTGGNETRPKNAYVYYIIKY